MGRFPSTIVQPFVSGMVDEVWRGSVCVLEKVGLALCFATARLAIYHFSDFLGNRALDADFLAFVCAVGAREGESTAGAGGEGDCGGGARTLVVLREEGGDGRGAKN